MPITRKKAGNFATAMLFISPFLIGFLLFNLYPIVMSLYYSFTDYSILKPPRWIGLDNYVNMMSDPLIWKSLLNTFYLIVVGIPVLTIASILIAVLLNSPIPGQGLFRTLVFLPSVVPPVSAALLWAWLLNPNAGLMNSILRQLGIDGPGWLGDPQWSKPSILLIVVWGLGNVMVLYLAALREVPNDLYEAASLDGANRARMLWHITIPSIRPVIYYNVITGVIALSQFFAQVYVVNTSVSGISGLGAPSNSTLFFGVYLYSNGFSFLKMGYASAMAWVLLVLALLATWLLLKASDVFTSSEEGAD